MLWDIFPPDSPVGSAPSLASAPLAQRAAVTPKMRQSDKSVTGAAAATVARAILFLSRCVHI